MANDVNSICKPLFECSPISFFSYGMTYKNDGSSCYLGSNPIWMECMLDKQFLKQYQLKCTIPQGYHMAENIAHDRFYISKEILKVNSGLIVIKEFENCYESISFGTPLTTNTASEFYLNNRDLLENFILYFKDKAAGLIKESTRPQNLIATDDHKSIISSDAVLANYNIGNIAVTRYFFNSGSSKNKLSQRETECLIYLLRGRTAKEIGKEFKLSPKSVEVYISRAQAKLGCDSRKDLFDKAIACGFIELVKSSLSK